MTLSITVREAKEALVQMKKLTPARPRLDDDAKLSLKEVVFLMAPELAAMTKRGFTLKELADGLQAQNIPIKPATLNRYLNEYKAGQAEGATGAEASEKETKKPPASSEARAAQESAETLEGNKPEPKVEEISKPEGASPKSEMAEEKSEKPLSPFWSSFEKSQEKRPPRPPQESRRDLLM
jgi:hypothetical protein